MQDFANTAWALATMIQLDEQLFAAVALAMKLGTCKFTVQDFATTAWAFATLIQSDAQLLLHCIWKQSYG